MTTTTPKISPAIVLLVEDDPGDQLLTKEAFESLSVPNELRVVADGREALDYLYRRGRYTQASEAPRPDLILLDLNMPRVNGQKVAEEIHADPQLRDIPIVVLTTSRRHEDLLHAYGRGVVSFITKPLDFQDFIAAVRDLEKMLKIFRLLRRQQEIEAAADALFQRQLSQMEEVLSRADAGPAAGPSREDIVRVARRILESLPEPQRRPTGHGRQASDSPATPGLVELARALDAAALETGSSRGPDPPAKGGSKPV
jgi:CheY-like chemotaxis protein